MKLLALLILALSLAGCRVAIVPLPNGRTAVIGSLLTDPHLASVKVNPDGSFELGKYESAVSVEGTKAVVSGVTEGAIRAFVKP